MYNEVKYFLTQTRLAGDALSFCFPEGIQSQSREVSYLGSLPVPLRTEADNPGY